MTVTVVIGIVVGVLTILGIIVGVVKFANKVFKQMDAIAEGVLGRPEVRDRSGAVIEKALPSIQARVSSLEDMLKTSNTEDRLTHLEVWRDEHTKETEHTRETNDVLRRWIDHMMQKDS